MGSGSSVFVPLVFDSRHVVWFRACAMDYSGYTEECSHHSLLENKTEAQVLSSFCWKKWNEPSLANVDSPRCLWKGNSLPPSFWESGPFPSPLECIDGAFLFWKESFLCKTYARNTRMFSYFAFFFTELIKGENSQLESNFIVLTVGVTEENLWFPCRDSDSLSLGQGPGICVCRSSLLDSDAFLHLSTTGVGTLLWNVVNLGKSKRLCIILRGAANFPGLNALIFSLF